MPESSDTFEHPLPDPGQVAAIAERARQAVAVGDALSAVEALQVLPPEVQTRELKQLHALALLRCGSPQAAARIIQSLLDEGAHDEETLGLSARVAKAFWMQSGAAADLAKARDAYLLAYRTTGGTWPAINAATLSLVMHDGTEAQRLAGEVLNILAGSVGADSLPPGLNDAWDLATVGEAALLLGRDTLAEAAYRRALAATPEAHGDHQSMRRNIDLIESARGRRDARWATVFTSPVVAVFTGHLVDAPDRATPRFPASAVAQASADIAAAISRLDVRVGVSAAACGGDILFLEHLQALGRETIIVLPHEPHTFREQSVTRMGGEAWGRRFDAVIAGATQVTLLAQHQGEDLSYQFQGEVMGGLAQLRADAVGGAAIGLVLWDGQPGAIGGTAAVAVEWVTHGMAVERLPFGGLPGGPMTQVSAKTALGGLQTRRANGQRTLSMLFADAVGFSKLGERQVKAFAETFLGLVRKVIDAKAPNLLSANTWGDGLFLTCDTTLEAARLAVTLAQAVQREPWADVGLPPNLNIRIGMHAGPVYEIVDPVTGLPGFAGMHISRAARIEPITPPGQVYCSEAFAALLALDDQADEFVCEYVGTMPMAKNYGRFRTYSLNTRGRP